VELAPLAHERLAVAVIALVTGLGVALLPASPAGASGEPSAPLNVEATAASDVMLTNGAVVTWTTPASSGTGDIISYSVTPFDQSKGSIIGATTVSGSPPETTATVTGLVSGDSYTFSVTATNGAGTSVASDASNAIVPVAEAPDKSNSASSLSPTGSVTASLGPGGVPGSVAATASGGEGTLTVATYPSEPIVGPSVQGDFYDVSVIPGAPDFDQIVLVFCGVTASQSLMFWNPDTGRYVVVTGQSQPTGTGRCVTVVLNASTTPDIADLTGTVFVVPSGSSGYDVAGADGGVFAFGNSGFFGSLPGLGVHVDDVVAMATTDDHEGYWLVAADGGVFAFGDARFHGSLAGEHLDAPVVGMTPTPDGGGYWLVAADGGVFAFGDARYWGSLPGAGVRVRDVTGMATSADGGGYWLVAGDGGVFTFGDAVFAGSMAAVHLAGPTVGIVASDDGGGYWLVGTDGGVFALGDAAFVGSLPAAAVRVRDVVGIVATPDGAGYVLVGSDGGVFAFGAAHFLGSMSGRLSRPAVGAAAA
jgi:hypothetical protein